MPPHCFPSPWTYMFHVFMEGGSGTEMLLIQRWMNLWEPVRDPIELLVLNSKIRFQELHLKSQRFYWAPNPKFHLGLPPNSLHFPSYIAKGEGRFTGWFFFLDFLLRIITALSIFLMRPAEFKRRNFGKVCQGNWHPSTIRKILLFFLNESVTHAWFLINVRF